MKPSFCIASAALATLMCNLSAQAADTLTLQYTAKLRWGEQSGPATSAVLNNVPVTIGGDGFYTVTGSITLGLTAPPVVGFGPASGYWSEEALQGFTMNFGSQTFQWINRPGSLNNRFGISLANSNDPGGDLVSTANSAQPYFGGIGPALTAAGAGNGLQTLTQPNAAGTRDLALGAMMFWWAGAGLLASNQLADESFASLANLGFGPSNAPAGTVASRLSIQMWALPSGSTDAALINNAHNADGYFTSVALAPVPEPSTHALLLLGAGALLVHMRRRRNGCASQVHPG
jgi:PEP-CTERM motif